MIVQSLLLIALAAQPGAGNVSAEIDGKRVVVEVDGKEFTSYRFDDALKKPYFWPLNGPKSGKSVTVASTNPYPHHTSLFFGCDRVNGCNFWQSGNDRGQIVSKGPKILKSSGKQVVFTDECFWRQPGKKPIILDLRRVTVSAPNPNRRILDFEITLRALVDITFLRSNHSLFSGRMMPELSVKSGGTLINAAGKTSEKGTWGVASPWCDYYGTRDGVTEGMAIMQHPKNRWYPSKWFTRDYGFFSPTPMYWLKGGKLKLPKGEELTLKYRVVVHAGDAEEADIKELFEQYKEAAEK